MLKKFIITVVLITGGITGAWLFPKISDSIELNTDGTQVSLIKLHLNFMGLNTFNGNEKLMMMMARQCESGEVENVSTQFSLRQLPLLAFEEITFNGQCKDR